MDFSGRLINFFSKDSKLDGRAVIGAILAVYFLSVFCSSFFMDYSRYWQMLGVPAGSELFMDLKAVTTAIKCPYASHNGISLNPRIPELVYLRIFRLHDV